ncbi:MAG: ImmA/IrrE family metallo-endopeptidase, partial [Chloroflexaceae bacterium]|nr:ImmA/IrrE family metallo-endopeptidase [Chloroflexaceae bacterium]
VLPQTSFNLYLPAPPPKSDRVQDFRVLPEAPSREDEGLLDALIRDVQVRQGLLRAALEDDEDTEPLKFIGSMQLDQGVLAFVAKIREILQLDLPAFREQPNARDAFFLLRTQTEKTGTFVLLIGNLGSHHTNIAVELFRGFAIADPIAPFIVINDRDAHTAWSFTLLHEFCHLLLGETGVSGGKLEFLTQKREAKIERFCNDVAGEILLPLQELNEFKLNLSGGIDAIAQRVMDFAEKRNLSGSMVAYRLFRNQRIEETTWRQLSTSFRNQWIDKQNQQKEKNCDKKGGPDYYIVRQNKIGTSLISSVSQMMGSGELTTVKAAKILGVKAQNLEKLISLNASSTKGDV